MDNSQNENDLNSLENPESVTDSGQAAPQNSGAKVSKPRLNWLKQQPLSARLRGAISHINVYLLIFILLVIVSLVVVFISYQKNKTASDNTIDATHELTVEELSNIAANSNKVGDPKQILNIESNAIFSGKVLLRSDLDVAGSIRVGNSLNLPGITVSGTSNFDQILTNQITIAGGASIQGTLAIQDDLTVSGGASFGDTISAPRLDITNLQLTGDLQLNRHIDAGGSTPSKANGTALGGGGTASNNGTDTAGTVAINVGSSPAAGCFVTLTFAQAFKEVPHVVITPVGSSAAGLNYYINRSTTNFSICSTNAAPASSSFSFDYNAFD